MLALSAGISACATQTVQWYEPLGASSLEEHQCGGPKEVVKLPLDEAGSTLKLWIEAARRDRQNGIPEQPTIHYWITLGPGSTVRIVEPIFVVSSPDDVQVVKYKLARLEAPGFKSVPADAELRHEPRGPNGSSARLSVLDNFYFGFVRLKDLPPRFRVRYPQLQVNGVSRDGPAIAYAASEGTFLLHRCFTGTQSSQ